jgi:hypothetical protein
MKRLSNLLFWVFVFLSYDFGLLPILLYIATLFFLSMAILTDFLKYSEDKFRSSKMYVQGDCKLFRLKGLNIIHQKKPMGRGVGVTSPQQNPELRNPPPNSVIEAVLKSVCSR